MHVTEEEAAVTPTVYRLRIAAEHPDIKNSNAFDPLG